MANQRARRKDEAIARSPTFRQVMVDHLWVDSDPEILRVTAGTSVVAGTHEATGSIAIAEVELVFSPEGLRLLKKSVERWEKRREEQAKKEAKSK